MSSPNRTRRDILLKDLNPYKKLQLQILDGHSIRRIHTRGGEQLLIYYNKPGSTNLYSNYSNNI